MSLRWPKKIATYLLILAFWLAIILVWLYSPHVIHLLQKRERNITAFVWADIIDPNVVKKFQEQTGIHVNFNYYESNDELLTKLDFSEGAGFDLIMPTQHMVKELAERGFLKKLNKSKLTFMNDIDPHFLGIYYDPHNDYAIPYTFDVFGLGIDRAFFAQRLFDPSWALLFDPPYSYRVGMTDEHGEIIGAAAKYLFGNITTLTPEQAQQVRQLLIKQKGWVEAYTDLTATQLLTSRTCAVVFSPSSYVACAMARDPNIAFVIPREGAFLSIENMVIPRKSDKDELTYQFINFLMRNESLRAITQKYCYLPVKKNVLYSIDTSHIGGIEHFFQNDFNRLSFIKPLLPRREQYQLWLKIKAH